MPLIIPCFPCFGANQNPIGDRIAASLQDKVGELFTLLWDWSLGWPTNLILLERNAEQLRREMEGLKEMRDDMNRRVECEEAQPSMERVRKVKGWLDRVNRLEIQVRDFQASLDRQSLCITGLCLGREAVEKLKRARELKAQHDNFNTVVTEASPDASTLEEEMEALGIRRDGLLRRVENMEAADPQMRRTPAVKAWLEKVATVDAEVAEFLRGRAGVGSHSTPVGYGEVAEKLRRVRKVNSQWDFDGEGVVTHVLPDAVENVHSKPISSIVGGEEALSKIRAYLTDPAVGIVGVWGMGGIGKTTLLKKINNELCAARIHAVVFDVVIWVTVKKERSILEIQKDIGERIGLSLAEADSGAGDSTRLVKQQAKTLLKSLSRKRFLLILDDLWERLDLEDVGIPFPSDDNGCKIVLTTRLEEVCIDMDAQEATVKVGKLNEAQSWELFRRTIRADATLRDPSIRPLAEKVVGQCGGLPLALVTVGRAMANKKLPSEWSHAVTALQDNAKELRGMEDKVLKHLKFSFDCLRSDTQRCCLLYCSLFPEDHEIDREQLVEYWVGEGFVDSDEGDDVDAMNRARGRGQVLVTDLQAACLLESGISDETNRVKLHDAVRDMALWLTGGGVAEYADRFLVHAGRGPAAPLPGTRRWEEAKRISFMYNTNLIFPDRIPHCPKTNTLLANGNPYTAGPCDLLFMSLPMLRVLDLSQARIYGLPANIGSLVHLRYLNISLTRMVSLPKELGRLVNLRQLDMRSTTYLLKIPLEAFSPLSSLQTLNMYCSNYAWIWEQSTECEGEQERGLCLKDLGSLEGLVELGLNITAWACLEGLLRSPRLTRCMKLLSLSLIEGLTPAKLRGALRSMERLQALQLSCCDQLEELQFEGDQEQSLVSLVLKYLPLSGVHVAEGGGALRCLQRLELTGCHSLKHITWAGRLPCLESAYVSFCNSMEDLLTAGEDATGAMVGGGVFQKLRTMDLSMLPLLRSIAPSPLPLPWLDSLRVYDCPELKRLPLGAESARRMRLISGKQEWWDGLEWEDQYTRGHFVPHFVDPSQ